MNLIASENEGWHDFPLVSFAQRDYFGFEKLATDDVNRCKKLPGTGALQNLLSDRVAAQKAICRLCVFAMLSLGFALSGCGSSSGSQVPDDPASTDVEVPGPETSPPLEALGDGNPLLTPVPDFVSTETRADTGIQVAFTSESQLGLVDGGFIEDQWQHMQTCLELISPPPLVIVVDGSVAPFTPADDVLFNFDGKINASASVSGNSLVIQIRVADFDGSLGNPGFNLRSIMGRSLWLSAGMAEKDYPFACARTSPENT